MENSYPGLNNWSEGVLAQCIGEELPPCQAACPLDIRVRDKLRFMQQGDLAAALAVVLERCPFPGILGRLCPHPCERACTRRTVDQAIAIAGLKRYLADLFPDAVYDVSPGPARSQAVAVVGGGPAGLMAAFELRREGYAVTLFEAEAFLGGGLRLRIPPRVLPREVLAREAGVVARLGTEVKLTTCLGRDLHLEDLRRDFAAVFLALGRQKTPNCQIAAPELEGVMPAGLDPAPGNLFGVDADPVTLQTGIAGVFAGGDLVTGPGSVVQALAAGRRAARALDGFLQGRLHPGDLPPPGRRTTGLMVDTRGVATAPRQVMPRLDRSERQARPEAEVKLGFTAAQARAEAGRCLNCACSQCVNNCPFLAHYVPEFPPTAKGLVRLLQGPDGAEPLIPYSCHYCGLCQAVCPLDLNAGRVCLAAREDLVAQEQGPLPGHKGIQNFVKWGASPTFTLTRPDPDTGKAARVFFPGCALAGNATEVVKAAYAYLRRRLPDTGIMLNCCGAPSYFMGEKEVMLRVINNVARELAELGQPEIIVACTHCYQIFTEFLPEFTTRTIYEILNEVGYPDGSLAAPPRTFHIQDACGARQAPQIHEAVRRLITGLGYEVAELAHNRERSICCGSGGMVPAVAPEQARKMTDFRLSEASHDLVTYCAACRARLAKTGYPTLHILDLLFNPDWPETKTQPAPPSLRRWWRRWRLKRNLRQL